MPEQPALGALERLVAVSPAPPRDALRRERRAVVQRAECPAWPAPPDGEPVEDVARRPGRSKTPVEELAADARAPLRAWARLAQIAPLPA